MKGFRFLFPAALLFLLFFAGCGENRDTQLEAEKTSETERISMIEEPFPKETENEILSRGTVLLAFPSENARWRRDADYLTEELREAGFYAEAAYGVEEMETFFANSRPELLVFASEAPLELPGYLTESANREVPVIVYGDPLSDYERVSFYIGYKGEEEDPFRETMVAEAVALNLLHGRRVDKQLIRSSNWDFACDYVLTTRKEGGCPAFLLASPEPVPEETEEL